MDGSAHLQWPAPITRHFFYPPCHSPYRFRSGYLLLAHSPLLRRHAGERTDSHPGTSHVHGIRSPYLVAGPQSDQRTASLLPRAGALSLRRRHVHDGHRDRLYFLASGLLPALHQRAPNLGFHSGLGSATRGAYYVVPRRPALRHMGHHCLLPLVRWPRRCCRPRTNAIFYNRVAPPSGTTCARLIDTKRTELMGWIGNRFVPRASRHKRLLGGTIGLFAALVPSLALANPPRP